MMTNGLSAAGLARLKETLCMPGHSVHIEVALLDLDHNYLMRLSDRLSDGQVNIAARNAVTRSASVSLWDPDHEIGIDSESPNSGALFYARMIKITYCVWRYGDTESVDIPIFCGPINKVSRNGGFLDVSCVGKETLAAGVVWRSTGWKKGSNRVNVLRSLMQNRAGETKFDFTSSTAKLAANLSYAKEQVIWEAAQKLARGLGRQLFYDGRGVLRLRVLPKSSNISFDFRDGRGGSLVKPPTIDYGGDGEIKNLFWTVGKKPTGKKNKGKKTPMASSWMPSDSAINHNRLGRKVGGKIVPSYRLDKQTNTSITSSSQAKTASNNRRDSTASQQAALKADVLCIPMLEESDWVSFTVQGEYSIAYRVTDMTIPLTGPVASFGSMKNLSVRRTK